MKVKKNYVRQYDGPWHESFDLEYENEILPFQNLLKNNKDIKLADELYLGFRNSAAAVNSFKIEEVEVPNPEICKERDELSDYPNWGSTFMRRPVSLLRSMAIIQISSEILINDPDH